MKWFFGLLVCWFWPGLGSFLKQPGCMAWILFYPTSCHCQVWKEGVPSGPVSMANRAIGCCLLLGDLDVNCSVLVHFINTIAVTVPVNCSYLNLWSLLCLQFSSPTPCRGRGKWGSEPVACSGGLEHLSGTNKLGSSILQSQQSVGKYSMIPLLICHHSSTKQAWA